jgi:type III secretion system FlhB-like substrate exporter
MNKNTIEFTRVVIEAKAEMTRKVIKEARKRKIPFSEFAKTLRDISKVEEKAIRETEKE